MTSTIHAQHNFGLVLFVMLALVIGVVPAAEPEPKPEPTPMFTMKAMANGINPYQTDGDGPMLPVTLRFRGDASRIDFTGPNGQRGLMVHDAATNDGWLLDLEQSIVLPIKSSGFRDLVVDPEQPCAHLPDDCQPARSRFVAGRAVQGWRYRNAEGRGPGGTSDGVFWSDPEHGVVLAYRGTKRGWDQHYKMRALSINYGKVPAVLFELPQVETVVDDGHAR